MENVAQDQRSQTFKEATANDLFDVADINSSSANLARPLGIGSGQVTLDGRCENFDYELRAAAEGAATLEVNGAGQELSAAGRLYSTIAAAVSGYLKKLAIAAPAAAAGLGLMGATENADATLMRDGSSDSAYRDLGGQYANQALWYESTGGVTGNSLRGSAVRLNSWFGLTAAHVVVPTFGTSTPNIFNTVGAGPNYLTNPGNTVPVASVLVYRGYDGTRNTPDLAIIRFAQPLPGDDLAIATSWGAGDVVTGVGFGTYGTPSTGLHPKDGNSRGWMAPIDTSLLIDASSTYYLSTFFGSSTQLTLNGKGSSGDSGGPLFNQAGNLIGINIAETGGTDPFGTTISLMLGQPEIHSWIDANSVVPEPSTFVLFVFGAGFAGLLSRRRLADQV